MTGRTHLMQEVVGTAAEGAIVVLSGMRTDTPSLKEQPHTRRGRQEVGRIVSANERAAKALKVQRTHLGKRLKKYGMTVDDWECLMWEQEGACAICRAELATFRHEGQVACVDHDHETGTVRGLLCYSCNVGIGFLRDDHDTMERAIQYLRGRKADHLTHDNKE